jgi:hypothetical protein
MDHTDQSDQTHHCHTIANMGPSGPRVSLNPDRPQLHTVYCLQCLDSVTVSASLQVAARAVDQLRMGGIRRPTASIRAIHQGFRVTACDLQGFIGQGLPEARLQSPLGHIAAVGRKGNNQHRVKLSLAEIRQLTGEADGLPLLQLDRARLVRGKRKPVGCGDPATMPHRLHGLHLLPLRITDT